MNPSDMSRRSLLGTGVTVFGLGSAGAVGLSLTDSLSSSSPDVPDLEEEGWEETADTEESRSTDAGPITIETATNTLRFRDEALIEAIRDREIQIDGQPAKRLGDFESQKFPDKVRVFSATRADLKPDVDDLPAGIGLAEVLDRVAEQAKGEFESELEDAGLEDIEEEDTDTLDIDTGQEATVYYYSAIYPFEGIDDTVRGQDISLPAKDIEFAGQLAIWDNGEYVLISAGAYPNENYEESATGTGEYGGEVTASLDLQLTPEDYRDDTEDIIAEVE
jgi:hypothetical protein